MQRLAAILWRASVRKGAFGGDRTWVTLFAIFGLVKVARRLSGSVPEVVFQGKLEPGQRLVIDHFADQTLGGR